MISKKLTEINPSRSQGNKYYDIETREYYLDFSMNSMHLPLGYENDKDPEEVYSTEVLNSCIHPQRLNLEFKEFFYRYVGYDYENYLFTDSDSLAIEKAVKHTVIKKGVKNPVILSAIGDNHGLDGLAYYTTDKDNIVGSHIENLPSVGYWIKISNNLSNIDEVLDNIDKILKDRLTAMIIEPIQYDNNNKYISKDYIMKIKNFCDKKEMSLIFDETRCGFGSNGKTMWMYEQYGVTPDVVVFGGFAQVHGFMTNDDIDYNKLGSEPIPNNLAVFKSYVAQELPFEEHKLNISENVKTLTNGLVDIVESDEYEQHIKSYSINGLITNIELNNKENAERLKYALNEFNIIYDIVNMSTVRFIMCFNTKKQDVEDLVNALKTHWRK